MEGSVSEPKSADAQLYGVGFLAIFSSFWGLMCFTAYLPLQAIGSSFHHYVGAFLFYCIPFAACYALSHLLFDWISVDNQSGARVELGVHYVRVSFWCECAVTAMALPYFASVPSGFCGCGVQSWVNFVTALPLMMAKGIALLDRWRGKSRLEASEMKLM